MKKIKESYLKNIEEAVKASTENTQSPAIKVFLYDIKSYGYRFKPDEMEDTNVSILRSSSNASHQLLEKIKELSVKVK